jgi:lysophospholipase L1-like esterase
MGWAGSGAVTYTANSALMSYFGSHSLAVGVSFSSSAPNGNVYVSPPAITDLTAKMIVARVWIPANFPQSAGGTIFIETGTAWAWLMGNWNNFNPGQWNTIYYNPNLGVSAGTPTPVLSDVREMGVTFAGGSWNGTLYLDGVDIIAAPPAATATPVPSSTPGPGTPSNTPTQTATPSANSPDDPSIIYYGRWDRSDPGNYRADWGPAAIQINFTGTGCAMKMTDSNFQDIYEYSLDSAPFVQMAATTATAYTIASGLVNASHTLYFTRRTEASYGVTNFQGFYAPGGSTFALTAPSVPPAKKMEFIGDSISSGTNDECGYCTASTGYINTNQNGYMAFGPQTARYFNAQYSVTAKGGMGVYYNSGEDNSRPELHAADYFTRTLFNFSLPQWDFTLWQPDAVVIQFGGNDWGHSDTDPLTGEVHIPITDWQFETAYIGLIGLVRSRYPSAKIFCMGIIPSPQYPAMAEGTADIQAVVNGENSGGDAAVYFLAINDNGALLAPSDFAGDNTHPLDEGHTKIMNKIVPQIRSVMGW